MSIGDVHSDARGSGARFNDGKAPLHLIPLRLIADSFDAKTASDMQFDVSVALARLGDFQTTSRIAFLDEAFESLHYHWRDCASVFDYGRKKYAEWNWAKGMAWSIPLACAARHALAILEGETIDPESGMAHVGHLLCNVVMLRTFVDSYPEGNDLPPPRLFARLPQSPDYDPASVAFRHGDLGWLGEVAASEVCQSCGRGDVPNPGTSVPKTAVELADADGCIEYGNPVTPGCAISFAQTGVNAKDISHYATRQSDSWSVSYGGKRP